MEPLNQEEPKEMMNPPASPTKPFARKKWTDLDKHVAFSFLFLHLLCLLAPFYFTWGALWLAFTLTAITGMGISVSYHRNLAHRSFKLPKWLEYSLAYCGAHALQGNPIDWVSTHRCHHRYVDTERDPHSPIQGFWFSHIGWLFDSYTLTKRVCPNYFNNFQKIDRSTFMLFSKHGNLDNVFDLEKQPFYTLIRDTYFFHLLALAALLYVIGGVPFLIWGMCVRIVVSLQITCLVNSVCHTWGKRRWNTNDLSKNNWWVALLTYGEGWHNNHHAFEYSARHGHDWWQIDFGWYIIKFLKAIGVATDVKLPPQNQRHKMQAAEATLDKPN